MKVLKFLLILIGLLIGAGVIAGILLPKTFSVERSIEIDAPKDVIFSHISHLEKHNAWSPWEELDPNMKHTYEGEDGTVGFISKWEGNKEVGKGEQEIKAVKVNERIDTELRFIEPMEDVAQAYLTMEDGENGTKVSWGMNGKSPFPGNVFMAIMGVEKTLSKQFDQGLAKLKEIVLEDAKNKAEPTYQIQSVNTEPKTYMAHRATVSMDKITEFYTKHFETIAGTLTSQKAEMAGMPSGLFYSWDEETGETDMAAAIPVANPVKMGKEYKTIKLPGGTALVVDYYGPYEASVKAHNAIDAHMKANNLKIKFPVIEEYITDPGTEPDPSKWLTRITYFIDE